MHTLGTYGVLTRRGEAILSPRISTLSHDCGTGLSSTPRPGSDDQVPKAKYTVDSLFCQVQYFGSQDLLFGLGNHAVSDSLTGPLQGAWLLWHGAKAGGALRQVSAVHC